MRNLNLILFLVFAISCTVVGVIQFLQDEWIAVPPKIIPASNDHTLRGMRKLTLSDSGIFGVYEISSDHYDKKSKALHLQRVLSKHKFSAYIEKRFLGKRPVYVVKIGPFLNESDASGVLKRVHKISASMVLEQV